MKHSSSVISTIQTCSHTSRCTKACTQYDSEDCHTGGPQKNTINLSRVLVVKEKTVTNKKSTDSFNRFIWNSTLWILDMLKEGAYILHTFVKHTNCYNYTKSQQNSYQNRIKRMYYHLQHLRL